MKKILLPLLMLVLLCTGAAAETALYTTTTSLDVYIRSEMNKKSSPVGSAGKGATVQVYALYPEWAYVGYNGARGYINRAHLNVGRPVDKVNTPPWGVEVYTYTATVGQNGASILSAPEAGSEPLFSLTPGTKISVLGFEDGWAVLNYYRQYGYVDASSFCELQPIWPDAFSGTDEAPIAAFTSYYVINSTEPMAHGKEINIGVNCKAMSGETLAPGKTLNYNNHYGPFKSNKGYIKGPVLITGGWSLGWGGGVCQVSSTLYNAVLQLPGITIIDRRAHGADGAAYLCLGMDAAVGNNTKGINFIFRNDYEFPIRFEALAQDGALYIAIYRVTAGS